MHLQSCWIKIGLKLFEELQALAEHLFRPSIE